MLMGLIDTVSPQSCILVWCGVYPPVHIFWTSKHYKKLCDALRTEYHGSNVSLQATDKALSCKTINT